MYVIAGLIVFADQLSKTLVRFYLPEQQSFPEGAPIRFVHTANAGATFGILQGQTAFFIVIAIVVIGVILTYDRFLPGSSRWSKLALGLQLGGALGNLIDRVLFRKVTDFIATDFWPTFNVADSAIVVGVSIMVILLFLGENEKSESLQPTSDHPQSLPN